MLQRIHPQKLAFVTGLIHPPPPQKTPNPRPPPTRGPNMPSQILPETHHSLVLSSIQRDIDAKVQTGPVPQVTSGGVVVKVILASVLPYAREVYDGTRQYPMPLPYVMGSNAIARIVAV